MVYDTRTYFNLYRMPLRAKTPWFMTRFNFTRGVRGPAQKKMKVILKYSIYFQSPTDMSSIHILNLKAALQVLFFCCQFLNSNLFLPRCVYIPVYRHMSWCAKLPITNKKQRNGIVDDRSLYRPNCSLARRILLNKKAEQIKHQSTILGWNSVVRLREATRFLINFQQKKHLNLYSPP